MFLPNTTSLTEKATFGKLTHEVDRVPKTKADWDKIDIELTEIENINKSGMQARVHRHLSTHK